MVPAGQPRRWAGGWAAPGADVLRGVTTTLPSNAENAPLFSRLDVLADEAAAYWTWGYVQKYTF